MVPSLSDVLVPGYIFEHVLGASIANGHDSVLTKIDLVHIKFWIVYTLVITSLSGKLQQTGPMHAAKCYSLHKMSYIHHI